jgi:hypothetical protein
LERWSLDGELLDVLLRKADWVRPRGDAPEEGEDYSFLSGFSEDRVGRLWVLTVRSRYSSIPTRVGMGAAGDDESIIEVLDPSNGTLIASLWDSKRREWAVPGQGFFTAEARESPEGIIFTDIWTFRMDPGGSQGFRSLWRGVR